MIKNLKRIKLRLTLYIRYLYQYFFYMKLETLISKGDVDICLEGGLGDIIMSTQFINNLKAKYPLSKIRVYYRDDDKTASPDAFSWGITRKYATSTGNMANPIREWIDLFYDVDDAYGCELGLVEANYSLYPPKIGAIKGFMNPREFNRNYLLKKLPVLEISNDAERVKRHLDELKDRGKKIVTLHLRRNSDRVLQLATMLQSKSNDYHFIILGSSEHQLIPDCSILKNKTSLVDSYSLGINTLELFRITSESDLFIGGRGGFELFHWLAEVPSINFFDNDGYLEVDSFLWPKSLWETNKINKLYASSSNLNNIIHNLEMSGL